MCTYIHYYVACTLRSLSLYAFGDVFAHLRGSAHTVSPAQAVHLPGWAKTSTNVKGRFRPLLGVGPLHNDGTGTMVHVYIHDYVA